MCPGCQSSPHCLLSLTHTSKSNVDDADDDDNQDDDDNEDDDGNKDDNEDDDENK